MAQSRGKLIEDLTQRIARTAIGAANLSAEDRVLAGQRVQRAIAAEATAAHRDVAAWHRDKQSPDAEPFFDYLHSTDRPHVEQDRARPDGAAALDLAAEMLATDTATNDLDKRTAEYAADYIAHAALFAAEAEARKLPGGPSQGPAVAAGAAAAGPVAAPVAVAKAGGQATKPPLIRNQPPSIG
ncbi:hypothetical protein [Kribbella sp. NPDC004536]|uniref:hypothetical protein n=1 Tax=Kribbella sp. NPDC004536 TaxID=3364106 RepID=UPI0036A9D0DB